MDCGHIYVTNGQNKKTLYIYNFFRTMHSFQKLVQKVAKTRTSNMNVYYIIPLNYRLTGHSENFKIKLYYFQERLSWLCFIYVSNEITNFQRNLFFKEHSRSQKFSILLSILSIIVSVICLTTS